MAIYHCSVKTFSRSKGQTAVAAAAYRTGKKLQCEFTGKTQDYSKRKGVVCSEIVKPDDCPSWANQTNSLWNEAEKAESRKNSTVAREFEISLPHELDQKQRLTLARDLTRRLVKRFGFVAEFSIHKPEDETSKNHHVHILATTRKITGDGFGEKTRELDTEKSGAVLEVREMVAKTINQHLEEAKINQKVDHRSLLDQQKSAIQKKDWNKAVELCREPTKHIGKKPAEQAEKIQFNAGVQTAHIRFLQKIIDSIELTKTAPEIPEKIQKQFGKGKSQQLFSYALSMFIKGGKKLIETDYFGIERRQKADEDFYKQVEMRREQAIQAERENMLKEHEANSKKSEQKITYTPSPRPAYEPAPEPRQEPEQEPAPRRRLKM